MKPEMDLLFESQINGIGESMERVSKMAKRQDEQDEQGGKVAEWEVLIEKNKRTKEREKMQLIMMKK